MANFKHWLGYLILVSLITVLPSLLLDSMVFDEVDYLNYFSSWIPEDSVEEFVQSLRKWRWVGYPITLLVIALKSLMVAGMIWLAVFLGNKALAFKEILVVCLKAQFVFAIKGYILLCQALFTPGFRLESLQNFHPLSMVSFFEENSVQPYWTFILQSINLFEVAYWFVLGFFIAKLFNYKLNDGLKIVASSYIPGFTIWLALITFLLISTG